MGWEHWPCDKDAGAFAELGLDPSLSSHLKTCGFHTPRKIQAAGIPAILTGRDVLLGAGPGSGKTLAYLAPIVHDLQVSSGSRQLGDGCIAGLALFRHHCRYQRGAMSVAVCHIHLCFAVLCWVADSAMHPTS